MEEIKSELVAWLLVIVLSIFGAVATFVAWVFRTFLFDRVKALETKLGEVERTGADKLAKEISALREEVKGTGEALRKEVADTRIEIKQDFALYLGSRQ